MSSVLQRAADATACQMLNDIGRAGTEMAVWTMWAPKVALVPLTVGGLSYMANNLLCGEMDGPPTNSKDPLLNGCIKGAPGKEYSIQHRTSNGTIGTCMQPIANEIVSVGEIREFNGKWGHRIEFLRADGTTNFYNACVSETQEGVAGATYWLNVPEGECSESNNPDNPGTPTPPTPDYDYTDPETNCNYTLKLEGFVQQYENGPAEPVWNIRSADSARNDGGRIGGCNLSPTIYIGGDGSGGGGGQPPQFPVPPEIPPDGPDGVPWWLEPLLGATVGALLNQIGNLLNDTFNFPVQEGSFVLTAPCDYTEEGENEEKQWLFPEKPLITRLYDHQVAMMEIMQQHLNWRTPTCNDNGKPILEGEFRTISFISDQTSPYGKSRLRKRFRYRSTSSIGLDQLVEHWRDFVWEAGPVCVQHAGASWGTPQVWAASIDEGKRVIRHAAREAGIDPDQDGRWVVSGSDSPRVGVSGTMRVNTKGGYYWVTDRDGSNSRPQVLAT